MRIIMASQMQADADAVGECVKGVEEWWRWSVEGIDVWRRGTKSSDLWSFGSLVLGSRVWVPTYRLESTRSKGSGCAVGPVLHCQVPRFVDVMGPQKESFQDGPGVPGCLGSKLGRPTL